MVWSLLLAVLAAFSNAASNVLQRIANKEEPQERQMSSKLVWSLLHRKVWLAGFAAVVSSFLLQAGALRFGQLALVQPIIILELPLTLIGAAIILRSPLHRREWGAVILMSVGLGMLIAFMHPRPGAHQATSGLAWAVGVGGCVAIIAALVVVGLGRDGAARAAVIGGATGIAFGLTGAFTKAAMQALSGGIVGLLTAWQTYAMGVSGLAAMFLMQNALQAGRLVAAQPGISLLDPFIAILWGVFAFHERTNQGLLLVVAGLGGAMMVAGALVLSRSPLLEATHGEEENAGRPVEVEDRPARG